MNTLKPNKYRYLDSGQLIEKLREGPVGGLWTVRDVAGFLNIKEATVRDWVYRRTIPFLKVGRILRFVPIEIEKWATEGGPKWQSK